MLARPELFDAAAKLFVAEGYEATTMADIAAEAGTSRRTAFNHFPNKGDIPMCGSDGWPTTPSRK